MNIQHILDNIFRIQSRKYLLDNMMQSPSNYMSLVQPVQHQDDIVGHDRLRVSNEFYSESRRMLETLKNHDDVIRFMTYNIYEWNTYQPKMTRAEALDKMLTDILFVNPTILCLQEYNTKLFKTTDQDIQTKIDSFNSLFKPPIVCMADYGNIEPLYNAIFVKHDINYNIINNQEHNIQKTTDDRCGVFMELSYENNLICSIANVHLHVGFGTANQINDEIRLHNIEQVVNLLNIENNKNRKNSIIIGDFNSYRKADYNDKQKHEFDTAKKGFMTEGMYNVSEFLNDKKFIEGFDYFFNQNQIKQENRKYPINTNRYGGRIDFIYLSPEWDIPILGMYKLYSDASDHAPIIMDIYYKGYRAIE